MRRKLDAYIDGLFIGTDPIGLVIGSYKGDIDYTGFLVDKYGFREDVERKGLLPNPRNPIKRTLDEQIIKGIGFSCGLISNFYTFGLLQIIELSNAKIRKKIRKIYQEAINDLSRVN